MPFCELDHEILTIDAFCCIIGARFFIPAKHLILTGSGMNEVDNPMHFVIDHAIVTPRMTPMCILQTII